MPFYDLRCKECGEEFNIMAKMSDRDQKLIKCPKCQCTEVETVFKSVNIVQSRKSSDAPACPNTHVCGSGCCHARG